MTPATFHCDHFRCRLTVKACQARQAAYEPVVLTPRRAALVGVGPVMFEYCATRCVQKTEANA